LMELGRGGGGGGGGGDGEDLNEAMINNISL